jgi:hypothetical protein
MSRCWTETRLSVPGFLAALALAVALFVKVTLLRAESSAAWRNGPLADCADNGIMLFVRQRTLRFHYEFVPRITPLSG